MKIIKPIFFLVFFVLSLYLAFWSFKAHQEIIRQTGLVPNFFTAENYQSIIFPVMFFVLSLICLGMFFKIIFDHFSKLKKN